MIWLAGTFIAALALWCLALRWWSSPKRGQRLWAVTCLVIGIVLMWNWAGWIEPLVD